MPENTAQSASTAQPKRKYNLSTKLKIVDLLRPHWTALTFAFLAVLGETLTDVLEPWPVKIVVDNLLQHKRLPHWIGGPVTALFGDNQIAILNFAVAAVAAIAIVGALSFTPKNILQLASANGSLTICGGRCMVTFKGSPLRSVWLSHRGIPDAKDFCHLVDLFSNHSFGNCHFPAGPR
jgi:hypothetical protein